MIRVLFTGGGTAGHVNPNLALIDALEKKGCDIVYIGSKEGIEGRMVSARHIPYYSVRSGKLRRYFSWKNFIDPFNLLIGIFQAYRYIRRLKPNVIFSKGGFVALPVVIGAKLRGVPVIAHESDLTPGLANRLSMPFINQLCVTFAGTKAYIYEQSKVLVTGTPIREELLMGSAEKGLALCGFNAKKPCLLVLGGSQGARAINACVRRLLDELTVQYQVIHLCGKGNLDTQFNGISGYHQFEYVETELADLFAASSLVISRAGANALYEILACGKPHILIPLSRHSSRGDQIHNAQYFEKQGISVVVEEQNLSADMLLSAIAQVESTREEIVEKIVKLDIKSATETIVQLILNHARAKCFSCDSAP
jgi:UDP-N-acetylglucosamine--N-acetylmuramyl-(pentapeptide) pyrophosphoryl-undecaprenol N-acetylglucosamine transferase